MTTGEEAVAAARRLLGAPYVYGATGPTSFDCSGLAQYVYHLVGVSLPRTSEEQYTVGTPITAEQLQPGDLVFSPGADGSASAPGHVGIYAGNGQLIVAPHTGTDVQVQQLANFSATGYRRPPGLSSTGSDTGTAQQVGSIGDTAAGIAGGLFGGLPSDVVGFFSTATDDLTSSANFFRTFFQPSTYVRLGAGFFGALFLITGIVFLVRETRNGG